MTDEQRMTVKEADALERHAKLVFKAAKAGVDARKAEMLREFEATIAKQYCIDDPAWGDVARQGAEDIRKAQSIINRRIRERFEAEGLPVEFAPSLSVDVAWLSRGENAARDRRTELRKVAETAADAMAKDAKARIASEEVRFLRDLTGHMLTSGDAKQWLSELPTVEGLLPALNMAQLEEAARKANPYGAFSGYAARRYLEPPASVDVAGEDES